MIDSLRIISILFAVAKLKKALIKPLNLLLSYFNPRVSVQGIKSLGSHFACLCRGFEFYQVKKILFIIFQKENGNTFTLLIIFIVKSLQKEQNSTNLLL